MTTRDLSIIADCMVGSVAGIFIGRAIAIWWDRRSYRKPKISRWQQKINEMEQKQKGGAK